MQDQEKKGESETAVDVGLLKQSSEGELEEDSAAKEKSLSYAAELRERIGTLQEEYEKGQTNFWKRAREAWNSN